MVFDVIETLLDLSPLDKHFRRIFGDKAARPLWFGEMLQSAMTMTITGEYQDFSKAADAALKMIATQKGIRIAADDRKAILGQIRQLPRTRTSVRRSTRSGTPHARSMSRLCARLGRRHGRCLQGCNHRAPLFVVRGRPLELLSPMKKRAVQVSDDRIAPADIDELLERGYRYAFSLAHDAAEADDLLQDACLSILGSGAKWERAYLFATIRNRFIDRYRRNRKIMFLSLEAEGEKADGENVENWSSSDVLLNGQLERALASLRAEEREALFLAVVEGYTADEIAELTSRPRGTILSLLHRTKAKLRELLGNNGKVL